LPRCALALAEAARWADRNRFTLDPRGALAGPIKYWKWRTAKKLYAEAARELAPVKDKLPGADLAVEKIDILNDLFGYGDITPSRLASLNWKGPSPIKQLFGAKINAQQRFETARLEVDNLMSEVGSLHAKLRTA
jgi:hypothetical protein